MVVTLHHCGALVFAVFFELLLGHFGQSLDVFVADCLEGVVAPMLVRASGLCDCVSLVVAFFAHVGTQFVIVDFMAIFALGLLAGLLHKLDLCRAVLLYFLVGHL